MKRSKKYLDSLQKFDRGESYDLGQALSFLEGFNKAKYDETVEFHCHLGVDPRKADQQIRSSLVLPNGSGKSVSVLVIADGQEAEDAKAAGADYVGVEDMVEKIQNENWLDFDVVIATPAMMSKLGKVAKILGPRGLMPNPKVGTVTKEVANAVKEVKGGRIEYRTDKLANLHFIVGKRSFASDKLQENILACVSAVLKDKPQSLKGEFIKSMSVCSTISPGVKLDVRAVMAEASK